MIICVHAGTKKLVAETLDPELTIGHGLPGGPTEIAESTPQAAIPQPQKGLQQAFFGGGGAALCLGWLTHKAAIEAPERVDRLPANPTYIIGSGSGYAPLDSAS